MYIEGFVTAVPKKNKSVYEAHARKAGEIFKELGATRFVECWQDDLPHGKTTDFYGAVKAKEDEAVLFSWIEYPSKEVRDEANKKMMADPRMEEMGKEMPFDGSRMIFGGFSSLIDVH